MKKILFSAMALIATLFASAPEATAQSQFKKGDKALNIDWTLGTTDWDWNNEVTNGFNFFGEYGFMNVINEKGTISAGVNVGAGFGGTDYSHGEYKFTRIRIGTRGTLHYSFIPQLDTYAGINFLFVDIEKTKYEANSSSDNADWDDTDCSVVAPSLVAGCRYMFTSNFGLNLETSMWDKYSHLAFGVTFKF